MFLLARTRNGRAGTYGGDAVSSKNAGRRRYRDRHDRPRGVVAEKDRRRRTGGGNRGREKEKKNVPVRNGSPRGRHWTPSKISIPKP